MDKIVKSHLNDLKCEILENKLTLFSVDTSHWQRRHRNKRSDDSVGSKEHSECTLRTTSPHSHTSSITDHVPYNRHYAYL